MQNTSAQDQGSKPASMLRLKAEFEDEMAPYRLEAKNAPSTSPASAALALRSLDTTVFDEEMARADTPRRAQLKAFKNLLRDEDDPLSEFAFKVRKTALLQSTIQDPEARQAMMKTLAVGEVSAEGEKEHISSRTQEIFMTADKPYDVPSALRGTVLKHAKAMGMDDAASANVDPFVRDRLENLANPKYNPQLVDVHHVNQTLIQQGGLFNEDMRTDIKAMTNVISEARQVELGLSARNHMQFVLEEDL